MYNPFGRLLGRTVPDLAMGFFRNRELRKDVLCGISSVMVGWTTLFGLYSASIS